MKNSRIASIIVSAGYSSRMGDFKPLLKFGGFTAIETIVNTYKSSGIEDIIVVVGHRGDEVKEKLKESGAICVINENYPQGMYSSILKGLEALDSNISAFFVHPVDIPLVKKITVEELKNKYAKCSKGIIYPVFCREKGHPVLIDCRHKKVIESGNGEGGLREILENFADDSVAVPVYDQTILMDMDTQEDYEELLRYYCSDAPNMK